MDLYLPKRLVDGFRVLPQSLCLVDHLVDPKMAFVIARPDRKCRARPLHDHELGDLDVGLLLHLGRRFGPHWGG